MAETNAEKPTILIVDDVPGNIKTLATILEANCEVLYATNGQKALEIACSKDIDLILLDVIMPEMDGFEVCKRLKNDKRSRGIPVIFITVRDGTLDEEQGLQIGAMDYIIKPFNPTIIQAKVKNHLDRICFYHRNRLLLDATQEGIYGLDADGNMTFINPAAIRMLGWEKKTLLGQSPHSIFHHSHANGTPYPQEACPICCVSDDSAVYHADNEVFWHQDSSSFFVEYTSSPIHKNGRFKGVVVVFRDITQQKILEKKDLDSTASRIAISALLETSIEPMTMNQQLAVALDIILSVPWLSIEFKGSIFTIDKKNTELVLRAQKGFPAQLLSKCARVPLGHCLCGLAAQTRQTTFANSLDERHTITFPDIHDHGHYCLPIISKGKLFGVLNCYIPPRISYNASVEAFLTSAANTLAGIMERRQLEAQLTAIRENLAYTATHDGLTNLPNRSLFHEQLHQSLALARREKTMMALMFIDLDRFKHVNDTFGHEVGDMLLVECSKRIRQTLRESDSVARLGGDEFTVILGKITTQKDAILVAEKIIDLLQQPFLLNQNECHIGSSIGISISPEHGDIAETLIKKADAAMYAVKHSGRNNYAIFQEDI